MRQILLDLIDRLIRSLQRLYDKATYTASSSPQLYHSLSPISTVEEKQYFDALFWALQYRKEQNIKNIALTGPYGSGKSSILKTFQFRFKHKFHFLNISLATFKEELKTSSAKKDKNSVRDESRDLLRLIELSILQQIFYHEKDSKIPDSRFKKIKSFKKIQLALITVGIILSLFCGFNIFSPDKLYNFLGWVLPPQAVRLFRITSLCLFIAGLFLIIYRSIRLLNGIKVSKLKFHDAEIEIDKEISKSILNNHLDEILYFFEVTGYDVVIIEDLDRFEQTEIFTKLRELNLLINNSKKIKKDVTFIYAVRDDMFQDKDRTKFFDFIIPVIPVINSSNSNNKLLKIVRDNKYDVSDDLIDDIGLFIDDMRLLYNITNEYQLYRQLLDPKLSQNKLLSIVVYKNIFPNDFVRLSNAEGDLFKVFANKQAHVNALQLQLDKEIEEIKKEISRLKAIRITDIKELRMLYLIRYIQRLHNFNGFYNADTDYSLVAAVEDTPFQLILDRKMRYRNFIENGYTSYYISSNALADINFSEIEKEVSQDKTYEENVADIIQGSDSKINVLRRQLQEIEKKKVSARHLKIKDLILSGAVKIEIDDKIKSQLINVLMRAGHIDEEYLDYISIFYEGAITKDDRDFLLNVKSQVATNFDFRLYNIDKLISKIGLNDFEQNYVLNFSLLDFLLANEKFDIQLVAIFKMLKKADNLSLSFIDSYIAVGSNIDIFIAKILHIWVDFWEIINSQSAYTDEDKFHYLDMIISYADVEDIKKIASNSGLHKALLGNPTLLTDVSQPEQLEEVIKHLNLSFPDILLEDCPENLVDFIYKESRYAINDKMLRRVLQVKGRYDDETYNKTNYEAILNSGASELINYVNKNLSKYIQTVYLQLTGNTSEPEISLLKLLNNPSISDDDRQAIVKKTTATISLLSESSYALVDELLLSNLRVKPLWENVINNFENNDNTFSEELVVFLNHFPNATALGEKLIDSLHLSSEENDILIDALIKQTSIDEKAFELLVKSISKISETPEFGKIDEEHAGILIKRNLVKLSPENFISLKETYDNLYILLIEYNIQSFLATIDDYPLDSTDVIGLLSSNKFSLSQKQTIMDSISEDEIISDVSLLSLIGHLALNDQYFDLTKKTLLAILTNQLSPNERIKLFNMNFRKFDNQDITNILQHLPNPHSDIAIKGRRPLLDHGQENNFFANNLKSVGYISKREDEKKGIRISTFKK